MKVKEVRDCSDVELEARIRSLKEELFNLRFQLATRQLDNPMRIHEVKKDIARVKTIQREREIRRQEVGG
ncbi:MAG: 50S ribosomal protein L29 [Bacillota bacterium]|nr:50S ribosomal protein L29 [Bacillota bacterium]